MLGFEHRELAPPVKIVDGLLAVPIDIQQLDAHVVFDMSDCRAYVTTNMSFITGDTDGNPIFDLRQKIAEASLNEETVHLSKIRHHDFAGGLEADMIILERTLPASSQNKLTLNYDLNQPQCPKSHPIGWDSPRLYFEFWFTDLDPARYLEMWFPSNLIYDQFKFNLEVEIIRTEINHAIYSNGQITQLNPNHWRIEFPKTFTSLSPMLVIAALDRIEYHSDIIELPDTDLELELEVLKLKSTQADLLMVKDEISTHISKNLRDIGPYVHGEKFTAFIWSGVGRGMEYDGGMTTEVSSIEHEVFHSWFGRGVKPASQNDGWIDEAWNTYNTSDNLSTNPFNMSEAAICLSTKNPYNRITPANSYTDGSRFFVTLAEVLGSSELLSYMNSFYKKNSGSLITTKQLESYLIDESATPEIANYFDKFVYGIEKSTKF